jgi:hypothetical protein
MAVCLLFIHRTNAALSLRGYRDILKDLQLNDTFVFENEITAAVDGSSEIKLTANEGKENYDWKILVGTESIATLIGKENVTGTNIWNVSDDKPGKTIVLNFHACADDEFPCANGECVDMTERCNLVNTCSDLSDEKNCTNLKLNNGYIRFAPNVKRNNQPIEFDFVVEIVDLQVAELKSNTFDVVFTMITEWSDPGITLTNLVHDFRTNKITSEEWNKIWQPNIVFLNSKGTQSTASLGNDGQVIYLQNMTGPLPDDPANLFKDQDYEGESGKIVMINTYDLTFYCYYKIYDYPFSIQSCQMNMSIASLKPAFVSINPNVSVILHSSQFGQYDILTLEHSVVEDKGTDVLVLEFQFKEATKFPLLNWYLPLWILILITQLTAYLDLGRMFETSLSLNATIFIAVSQFFSTIMASLAPSSQLTSFELWIIVTFIYPFIMIFVQVNILHPSCGYSVRLLEKYSMYHPCVILIKYKSKKELLTIQRMNYE